MISLVFPQACLICGHKTPHQSICRPCLTALPTASNRCSTCALPSKHTICGHCLRHSPVFDATFAAFDYLFPIDALIKNLKYRQCFSAVSFFAEKLASMLPPDVDLLLPVPMHPARLMERGFNHSSEIARILGKKLNIPVATRLVRRVRATPKLEGMKRKARLVALRNAFICDTSLDDKRIVVVDDVMTTGATLNALALCLKKAGAAEVINTVIARTPSPL